MDLSELRTEIDAIDSELVRLFGKRMEIAAQVADYKKENNLPIYVPAREREILKDVAEKAEVCKRIGIKNYILQKRLNAVHSGILCGEKIREAARAYGFEDYPAFFRLYKKSFGTAPSESKKPR